MKFPNIKFAGKIFQKMKFSNHRNPYRDWFLIVCFFTGITLLSMAFSGGLYYEIDRDTIFHNMLAPETVPLKINKEEIESVSGYYFNQEEMIKNLISGTSTSSSVDLSL